MSGAKIGRMTLSPQVGLRRPMRPNRIPAVDAKEQLRGHAAYVRRFVLMPVAFASSRLSAVARIALPRLVYVNRMWAETTKRSPIAGVRMCRIGFTPRPGAIGISEYAGTG